MGWRDRLPRRWREQAGNEPAPALDYDARPQAAEETSPDGAGSLSRRPDPDEAIDAEMAVMAARAAERAREQELDNQRVSMMAPRHRLEHRRMRWETINAVRISGMPPQRIEEEYRDFRFTQWEQQNAERVAPMSPGERQEMFRAEEMLTRYRAGLPPRDEEERDAYREWRQLDADVVNAYREEAEIPEQLWHEHVQNNGPLTREEFFAQYFADLTQERAASEHAELSSTDRRSVPGVK